eukprot:Skav218549  [mRNA]  locus=scaffold3191:294069:296166:+ [translate_table: standard]
MDDLEVVAKLVGIDHALASALKRSGWTTTKLGAIHGMEGYTMDSVAMGLQLINEGLQVDVTELDALVEAADAAAQSIWRLRSGMSDADLSLTSALVRSKAKLDEIRKARIEDLCSKVELRGSAPRDRWPTRQGRKAAALGDDPAQREKLEETERDRWIKKLKKLIHDGVKRDTALGDDDTGIAWEPWWPDEPSYFAEYLEVRAAEPCGKSVPLSVYKTLIFMEHAAEIPKERQISDSDAVKNALEEVNLRLAVIDPKERRQACHIPVMVVVSLEDTVVDKGVADFVRAYAWFRLFKLWGALRFHDTTGVDFKSFVSDEFGLHCSLKRTKTTGPGKKVTIVKVFVSRRAFVRQRDWLMEGWAIWVKMAVETGNSQRDFLLPIPRYDLEGTTKRMADYNAASAMSQGLFKALKVPGSNDNMFEPGAGAAWTEHSERVTLRTWAGAVGVPEDICKRLGRWTPTVDQAYDRSIRMQVHRAQEFIADFLQKNEGREDPFDEEVVLKKVGEKLEALGNKARVREGQKDRLRYFSRRGRPAKRLRWDGTVPLGARDPKEDRFSPEFASESEDDAKLPEDEVGENKTRMGHYVVSVVGKSKSLTLHRVGECFRQPGIHYREFVCYGDDLPGADKYHKACKACFPNGKGGGPLPGEASSSSGGELASSSSESSEDEA